MRKRGGCALEGDGVVVRACHVALACVLGLYASSIRGLARQLELLSPPGKALVGCEGDALIVWEQFPKLVDLGFNRLGRPLESRVKHLLEGQNRITLTTSGSWAQALPDLGHEPTQFPDCG